MSGKPNWHRSSRYPRSCLGFPRKVRSNVNPRVPRAKGLVELGYPSVKCCGPVTVIGCFAVLLALASEMNTVKPSSNGCFLFLAIEAQGGRCFRSLATFARFSLATPGLVHAIVSKTNNFSKMQGTRSLWCRLMVVAVTVLLPQLASAKGQCTAGSPVEFRDGEQAEFESRECGFACMHLKLVA